MNIHYQSSPCSSVSKNCKIDVKGVHIVESKTNTCLYEFGISSNNTNQINDPYLKLQGSS